MIMDRCKCGCCSLRGETMQWFCRGEPASTLGSQWKHCPFCGTPLTDFAARLQRIIKVASQVAEAFQNEMLRLGPCLKKVYDAAKAQGLLDEKDDEDDAD